LTGVLFIKGDLMQKPSYIVTGTLLDANTVKLDEALPLHSAKVRLTIEPLPVSQPNRYRDVMAEIRQRQRARQHQPPTPAEVDRLLREERDGWE
jgi:hypothetical protein